jgi:hypothetical protein
MCNAAVSGLLRSKRTVVALRTCNRRNGPILAVEPCLTVVTLVLLNSAGCKGEHTSGANRRLRGPRGTVETEGASEGATLVEWSRRIGAEFTNVPCVAHSHYSSGEAELLARARQASRGILESWHCRIGTVGTQLSVRHVVRRLAVLACLAFRNNPVCASVAIFARLAGSSACQVPSIWTLAIDDRAFGAVSISHWVAGSLGRTARTFRAVVLFVAEPCWIMESGRGAILSLGARHALSLAWVRIVGADWAQYRGEGTFRTVVAGGALSTHSRHSTSVGNFEWRWCRCS